MPGLFEDGVIEMDHSRDVGVRSECRQVLGDVSRLLSHHEDFGFYSG
jgi:hypothetical protein